jgi:hypothetical protein
MAKSAIYLYIVQNPSILKLPLLFSQYLYQHKLLNLPGIGSFELDPSVAIPEANDKNTADFKKFIRFIQKPVLKPDDEFIDFIRLNTGKIRPLAESDIDSFLDEGRLMLNIGKPFFITGIGTLHKNREGLYEFSPGEPTVERLEGEGAGEKIVRKRSVFDSGYSQLEPESNLLRKLLIAGGIIVGLTAIVWGGYILYNNNVEPQTAEQPGSANTQDTSSGTVPPTDSLLADTSSASAIDSTAAKAPQLVADPGSYKFVLETTSNKNRAVKRIAFLNTISPRMKMETNDSTSFKIFVMLPSAAADTNRIKDSLNSWYWGRKEMKVSIEK